MKYVIYLRVSTKDQGKSGLGLDAQRRDIGLYLTSYATTPHLIVKEFLEIDTGAKSSRKSLLKAINLCKSEGAILLVAKLDRLSRKVSFVAELMEDKSFRFVVASMPHADAFQLHIYAALAEQEREFISRRTKAALKEAKERGVKLGGLRKSTKLRNNAKKAQADNFAHSLWPIIEPMVDARLTLNEIATRLNSMNIKTANDGLFWPSTIRNILCRNLPN